MGTFAIEIRDDKGNHIGEMMTATQSDILKLINKGLRVINKHTGEEMTESSVNDTIGVSDGVIAV